MEMTLNANFLAIENNDLELINGGITYAQAVILAGVVLNVVGVALLFPGAAAILGISASIAAKLGAGLTVAGLAATLVGALQIW